MLHAVHVSRVKVPWGKSLRLKVQKKRQTGLPGCGATTRAPAAGFQW